MIKLTKFISLLVVFYTNILNAQVTLYYEPFTGQLNKGATGPSTTDVAGITTWTITTDFTGLTATSDWFKVVDDGTGNFVFEGRDVDVIQKWQSSVVNITGYSNTTISMDLTQTGGLDPTDYVSVYYVLDGAPQVLIGTFAGAYTNPTSINFGGLSGTTLQVIVEVLNNAGTEKYRFDNVKIVGDNNTSSEVTNLNATPSFESGGISWSTPTGCSDEILVIASTSSITSIPSGNGSAYTANSTYGLGTNLSANEYVVYKGAGNGFNLTGLTNEIQYCIKVFNRCGTAWSLGEETCFYPWDYRDTLVIMAYNVLNYPGSTGNRWSDFRTVMQYVKPDIVLCNEMISDAGATTLLNNGLNAYGINYYAKATFINGPDSDNIMYYNTNKVSLVTQTQIPTALRDISHYQVNWPNVNSTTTTLDLYSLHLKASSGATNENKRLLECQNLRTHMDGSLPVQSNIIVGGDFNFYGASVEPAWNELTNNGTQRLIDPKNRVGDWHDNSTYTDVHTQATRSTAFPGGSGGSTGGMDDRFDFLLANNYVMNGGNGVLYIPNSYDVIGNDGNKFNVSILENAPNTDVPDSVKNALFNMSDHLPVILKLQIDFMPVVLPVELINFTAEPNKTNTVDLFWTTASERNSDYFLVQKSVDGINFITFETVDAAGFSIDIINYHTIDESPYEGITYYRLVQVDINNDEYNVKTIALHFKPNLIDMLIYPNPNNGDVVNIYCENIYEREITVQFKNMLGQIIFEKYYTDLTNDFTIQLNLPSDLPSDVYIISLETPYRHINKKLVVK